MSSASVAVCVSTQVAACCSVTMCMRTRTAADDMTVFGTDGVMVPLDTFFQSASAVLVWHEDQPTAYVLTSRGAFQVRLHGTVPISGMRARSPRHSRCYTAPTRCVRTPFVRRA